MAIESWAYGWQWRAACRGEDTTTFFPPSEAETKEERVVREERAKSICARCPVRFECLEYSLTVPELYGIWGGLNEQERRPLIRERQAS
ncbi:MAG TPA: WhiB family transcriptional regulator [Actinomycetota bacterium]|nr:WhiB family transcriptional regulator [Actinomycetota bacterium]